MVYPGQVLLEGTNISEGRGTTRPFEFCGAPFIDPPLLKEKVMQRKLPGIFLREIFFQPTFHKWCNQVCGGVQLHITDPHTYKPYFSTMSILQDIMALYPDYFTWRPPPYEYEEEKMPIDLLIGDKEIRVALEHQKEIRGIEQSWQKDLRQFKQIAAQYYLYG
jgi:uncharacterized protein YbbC (DUF1343 family)